MNLSGAQLAPRRSRVAPALVGPASCFVIRHAATFTAGAIVPHPHRTRNDSDSGGARQQGGWRVPPHHHPHVHRRRAPSWVHPCTYLHIMMHFDGGAFEVGPSGPLAHWYLQRFARLQGELHRFRERRRGGEGGSAGSGERTDGPGGAAPPKTSAGAGVDRRTYYEYMAEQAERARDERVHARQARQRREEKIWFWHRRRPHGGSAAATGADSTESTCENPFDAAMREADLEENYRDHFDLRRNGGGETRREASRRRSHAQFRQAVARQDLDIELLEGVFASYALSSANANPTAPSSRLPPPPHPSEFFKWF